MAEEKKEKGRKVKKNAQGWVCKYHKIRDHDVFINYRVWCGSDISGKAFWYLQDRLTGGKRKVNTFLDAYCLNEGEDWKMGFINGLTYASLLVLLVQEELLDAIKNNKGWQDNVLLEYEHAMEKLEKGECEVVPVWVGKYKERGSRGVEPVTLPYDRFDAEEFPTIPHKVDGVDGAPIRDTMKKLFALREKGVFMDPENFHVAMEQVFTRVDGAIAKRRKWLKKQEKLVSDLWVAADDQLAHIDLAAGRVVKKQAVTIGKVSMVPNKTNDTVFVFGDDVKGQLMTLTPKKRTNPKWGSNVSGVVSAAASGGLACAFAYAAEGADYGTVYYADLKGGVWEASQDTTGLTHVVHKAGDEFIFVGEKALATAKMQKKGTIEYTKEEKEQEWGAVQGAAFHDDALYIVSDGKLLKAGADGSGVTTVLAGLETCSFLLGWKDSLLAFCQDLVVINLKAGTSRPILHVENLDFSKTVGASLFKPEAAAAEKKKE